MSLPNSTFYELTIVVNLAGSLHNFVHERGSKLGGVDGDIFLLNVSRDIYIVPYLCLEV